MDARELRSGIAELNALAEQEYGAGLSQVLAADDRVSASPVDRVGRLIGVEMKQPFAIPVMAAKPAPYTGARRAWNLVSEEEFLRASRTPSWQFATLEALRSDPAVSIDLGRVPTSVYLLAVEAHHERGFFGYLLVACRKYLCQDKKLRDEVEKNVAAAKRAGFDVRNITPETVVGAGGLALGTMLVQSIPVLGIVGAPVIAGFVLLIYSVGLDALCQWAADRDLRKASLEQA